MRAFINNLMQKVENKRMSLDLTQDEMGKRYSVSRRAYVNWLHREKGPSTSHIFELAKDVGLKIINIENTSATVIADRAKELFWLYNEPRKEGIDLPKRALEIVNKYRNGAGGEIK